MQIQMKKFDVEDTAAAVEIWNEVVKEGVAFPQTELLDEKTGADFLGQQSYTGIAQDADSKEVVGLYILHPNNIGRCGHICNASYAVKKELRGHKIGEALVRDCLRMGRELGFRILQFNAVVKTNTAAMTLYQRLGFQRLGVIPGGFLMKDGKYEDIVLYYIEL